MRTPRLRWLPLLLSLLAMPGAAQTFRRAVSEVAAHPIAGGKGTASILFDATNGSPEAALTLLVLQPGAAVPEHVHETSAELLYVLEGEAEMTLGGEAFRLVPNTAVRIPANAKQAAKAVSDRPFRALQVYAPAGPEQRFVPKK